MALAGSDARHVVCAALLPCPGMRAKITLAGLAVLLGTAVGCGGATPDSDAGGSGEVGTAPTTAGAATTTAAPVPTTSGSHVIPAGCPRLRDLVVGTPEIPLADFEPELVQLADGHYTSPHGATVELQDPCAVGDLDGDGSADAVGVVQINGGGTGRFFSVVVWLGAGGDELNLATSLALGDRNPVRELSTAADGTLTVVYLTRTDDVPMAEVNVKRTAGYHLTDAGLVEDSHTDEPYNPLNDG